MLCQLEYLVFFRNKDRASTERTTFFAALGNLFSLNGRHFRYRRPWTHRNWPWGRQVCLSLSHSAGDDVGESHLAHNNRQDKRAFQTPTDLLTYSYRRWTDIPNLHAYVITYGSYSMPLSSIFLYSLSVANSLRCGVGGREGKRDLANGVRGMARRVTNMFKLSSGTAGSVRPSHVFFFLCVHPDALNETSLKSATTIVVNLGLKKKRPLK